jgi:hypothetical protein
VAQLEDWKDWLAPLVGAIGAIGGGVMLARRRLSRDGVEITKDRAEVDILETVREERDQALERERLAVEDAKRMREQRTADAEIIARLLSDKAHLEADVRRLLADYRKMIRGLSPEVRRVLATEFSDLGPPEEPKT